MAAHAQGRVRPFDPTVPKGPLLRVLDRAAQLRPATWFLVNVGGRIDPVLMKLSSGRIRSTVTAPTVLLSNRGARSGKLRQTPLGYFTDGDDVILIASKGGDPRHPAWFHNVVANPDVELTTGHGDGGPYRARVATGAERERLWRLATTLYSGYDDYRRRAGGREIPVVVCSPRSGG
ncbi:MAG: nitroreductase family deazaflavin-dependent oxidoreductase [Actinobacteria bacterium]|nr:nitroreductase family deazaflavin-dependent oxidoreductase [Actinomycetota bacterium]